MIHVLCLVFFNEIHSIFEKANHLVEEVSSSSVEQNSNIDSINIGLTELTDAVSRNSSIAKDTADAYKKLSKISSQMQKVLEDFQLS